MNFTSLSANGPLPTDHIPANHVRIYHHKVRGVDHLLLSPHSRISSITSRHSLLTSLGKFYRVHRVQPPPVPATSAGSSTTPSCLSPASKAAPPTQTACAPLRNSLTGCNSASTRSTSPSTALRTTPSQILTILSMDNFPSRISCRCRLPGSQNTNVYVCRVYLVYVHRIIMPRPR